MVLILAVPAAFLTVAFFAGVLVAALHYQRRINAAEEFAAASHDDAEALTWRMRALQEGLAAGFPVESEDLAPQMPRTEALFLEAAERDLRRSFRVRRLARRAERAASQT